MGGGSNRNPNNIITSSGMLKIHPHPLKNTHLLAPPPPPLPTLLPTRCCHPRCCRLCRMLPPPAPPSKHLQTPSNPRLLTPQNRRLLALQNYHLLAPPTNQRLPPLLPPPPVVCRLLYTLLLHRTLAQSQLSRRSPKPRHHHLKCLHPQQNPPLPRHNIVPHPRSSC
jgi:hypothetical protein